MTYGLNNKATASVAIAGASLANYGHLPVAERALIGADLRRGLLALVEPTSRQCATLVGVSMGLRIDCKPVLVAVTLELADEVAALVERGRAR